MSKNFAEEYKTLANEELPDLWNRIEAGLTPKTTALAKDIPEDVPAEEKVMPDKKPEKGKVIAFLSRYRTVAAAAVCVVVILPAVIFLRRSTKSGGYESAVDNAAPAKAFDTTEAEAPAEAPAAEIVSEKMDDMIAEAAEADSDGAASRYSNMEKVMEDTAADSIEELQEALESEKESGQSSGSAVSQEEKKEQSENLKIYEGITVEAIEQTGETVKTERDFFYGVEMKVISDPSGELQEGTQITVWVSMLSSMAYVQGEEYELDLSYDPDRECPYRIERTYFS